MNTYNRTSNYRHHHDYYYNEEPSL